MKQITQNLRNGKILLEEVVSPVVRPGYVLVQTHYSLISAGTERSRVDIGKKNLVGKALERPDQIHQVLRSYQQLGWKVTLERVRTKLNARSGLGYSSSGTVLEVGSGVVDVFPGDHVACGGATAAHAEIVSIPANLCVRVPHPVALDHAAFSTVGAIALQGIRLGEVSLGDIVVVIGLGLIGQLTCQLLKANGCQVLGYDLDQSRCDLAKKMGADLSSTDLHLLKSLLDQLSASHGADAVLITAGSKSSVPVQLSGELAREKGRIVAVGAVGLNIPRKHYYEKELSLIVSRSYGPGRYDPAYEEKGQDYPYGYVRWTEKRNMQAFLRLLEGKKIDLEPLISHRIDFHAAETGYQILGQKGGGKSLGILFEYHPKEDGPSPNIKTVPSNVKSTGKIRVGFVGAGNFAQSILLPHLKSVSGVKLAGIYSHNPLASKDVFERFAFESMAPSMDDLLNDPAIDLIMITTRHDSHAELVMRCLRAGKPVFVEKPLALSLTDIKEMRDIYARSTNPFLMVGFNRRFAPMIRSVKAFFANTQEPFMINVRVNAGYIPLSHWTQDPVAGGGRILGEACHFIDIIQNLSNSQINSVLCNAMANSGKYFDDNIGASFSLENGSVAVLTYQANGDKSLPKESYEISSGGKTALLDDFQRLSLFSGGKKKTEMNGSGDKGHHHEMEALIEALTHNKIEPIPFTEAYSSSLATFGLYESLRKKSSIDLTEQ